MSTTTMDCDPFREIRVPFKVIKGGVTAPRGFRAAAVSCGIKNPEAARLDLALIVSDTPAVTDAVYTTNKVRAACVRVSQIHIRESDTRAIIANSGNANACTGPQGIQDAKAMCKAAAEALGLRMRQVQVCSTGIIGMNMPIQRVTPRIPELAAKLSPTGSDDAAAAIMTSDTKPKSFAIEVPCPGGGSFRIGGIAKGAGMICPDMATMLCFITTDAKISKDEIKRAMRCAVDQSFNCITIDGDTSTNDTVIVMSNGQASAPAMRKGSDEAKIFRCALHKVMLELAKMIVTDGERVTKFVEIRVRNARTHADAKKVAEAVAKSMLVKCSFHGSDPNWGRIIHAVGYSGARIREEMVDIYFGGLLACKGGLTSGTPVAELEKVVKEPRFSVTIDLNLGSANHIVYTSDLSEAYVDFNSSEYSAAVHARRQKGLA
ncbi:MAG TPA: bifunctional glutamate N-acetyltransferase/amino-acid acetyltransferase ArgJ [Prosthecobacter sp.]|nr:bifunctional glutamate N-acetyltransferase/amino-acid acetyltransferase ArgJ [Prosthecobacter sp.]HRK14893.1 bifunctional glutamate N-acetyltransferase/amino-acid acetyltransferase ArgJ [Prosthecobacter sp.]